MRRRARQVAGTVLGLRAVEHPAGTLRAEGRRRRAFGRLRRRGPGGDPALGGGDRPARTVPDGDGGVRPGTRRRSRARVRRPDGRRSRRREEHAAAAGHGEAGGGHAGALRERRGVPAADRGPRAAAGPPAGRPDGGGGNARGGRRGPRDAARAARRRHRLDPGHARGGGERRARQRHAGAGSGGAAHPPRQADADGHGAGRPRDERGPPGGTQGARAHDRLLRDARQPGRHAVPHAPRTQEPFRRGQRTGRLRDDRGRPEGSLESRRPSSCAVRPRCRPAASSR